MVSHRLRAWISFLLVFTLIGGWLASVHAYAEDAPPGDATPEVEVVVETAEPEPEETPVQTEATVGPGATVTAPAVEEPTAIPDESEEPVELSGIGATVEFDRDEGFVGDEVDFTVTGFPVNSPVQIVHTDPFANQNLVATLAPVSTDGSGNASGSFLVPVTSGSDLHSFRVAIGFIAGLPPTEAFSLSPGTFQVNGRVVAQTGFHAPGDNIEIRVSGGPFMPQIADLLWFVGQTPHTITSVSIPVGGNGSFATIVPNFATNGVNTIEIAGFTGTVNISIPGSNPTVELSTTRTTVNNRVTFTAFGFSANSTFTATWRRPGGSTIQLLVTTTNGSGGATGDFKVPATEGGNANSITFVTGSLVLTVPFDVAPRIKLIPGTGVRGGTVEVSLRGFTKGESIRIRWKIDSSFVLIQTVTASNTGSVNVDITIPNNAPIGANSVRADGTVWRQQTNAFVVLS